MAILRTRFDPDKEARLLARAEAAEKALAEGRCVQCEMHETALDTVVAERDDLRAKLAAAETEWKAAVGRQHQRMVEMDADQARVAALEGALRELLAYLDGPDQTYEYMHMDEHTAHARRVLEGRGR